MPRWKEGKTRWNGPILRRITRWEGRRRTKTGTLPSPPPPILLYLLNLLPLSSRCSIRARLKRKLQRRRGRSTSGEYGEYAGISSTRETFSSGRLHALILDWERERERERMLFSNQFGRRREEYGVSKVWKSATRSSLDFVSIIVVVYSSKRIARFSCLLRSGKIEECGRDYCIEYPTISGVYLNAPFENPNGRIRR